MIDNGLEYEQAGRVPTEAILYVENPTQHELFIQRLKDLDALDRFASVQIAQDEQRGRFRLPAIQTKFDLYEGDVMVAVYLHHWFGNP